MKIKIPILVLIILVATLFNFQIINSVVTGGSVTDLGNETAPADDATSHQAQAGNVTELNIIGYSTTQTWQGYFGNVSGTIQLADGGDNVFYNWTLASPEGEIYASTNSSITWTDVQCFNYTASGGYSDESSSGGTTNLDGTNLSVLEGMFNINSSDVDGVDETFTLSGPGTHDLFYTSTNEFSEGECRSTRIFGDTGQGVNNEFEEVLLYEPTSASVIFTSLLEEADTLGFDDANHDFEMLVLEDGHGVDTDTTTYYFFVELE